MCVVSGAKKGCDDMGEDITRKQMYQVWCFETDSVCFGCWLTFCVFHHFLDSSFALSSAYLLTLLCMFLRRLHSGGSSFLSFFFGPPSCINGSFASLNGIDLLFSLMWGSTVCDWFVLLLLHVSFQARCRVVHRDYIGRTEENHL